MVAGSKEFADYLVKAHVAELLENLVMMMEQGSRNCYMLHGRIICVFGALATQVSKSKSTYRKFARTRLLPYFRREMEEYGTKTTGLKSKTDFLINLVQCLHALFGCNEGLIEEFVGLYGTEVFENAIADA